MDYRKSHIAPMKGLTYDESFSKLPYRNMIWRWEEEILSTIVSKLRTERSTVRYLDFACGTGRVLVALEYMMDESYGVDVSVPMLNVAKYKTKQSKLVKCDITKQNFFSQGYFDIITAFRFFLFAQQELREEALRELRKIINNNGIFIFNIHMNKGCLLEREVKLYQLIKGERNSDFDSMGIRDTTSLLDKWGFQVLTMHHFGVIPVYSENHKFLLGNINAFERIMSHFRIALPFSQYVIYVCSPK